MTKLKIATSLVALALLPGCASIISGTTQEMTLNTTPSGADCTIMRDGKKLADVTNTPDTRVYERTKYDLQVTCMKSDCDQASRSIDSGIAPWTFGNILFGGLIGWGIDSANGADNEYEKNVYVPMNCHEPVATPYVAPEPEKPVKHKRKK